MSQPVDDDLLRWEEAYQRFETGAAEVRKFRRRLRWLGAGDWPRQARILELFCGRANGLVALDGLGFTALTGGDLSLRLLLEHRGPGGLCATDGRRLAFAAASHDVVVIQGGLHHLPDLPADLDLVLDEVRRVLAPGGVLAVVEPWRTPFLDLVHWLCRRRLARRLWPRLDALATMIDLEGETYRRWLARPRAIREALERRFTVRRLRCAWGKIQFVGGVRE